MELPVSLEEMIAQNERVEALAEENAANIERARAPVAVADPASALEVMRQLNPDCQDDDLLLRMLQAHISGGSVEMTAEDVQNAGGREVLLPVGGARAAEAGFSVKHSFRIRESGDNVRECHCVKVIESPEVLGVHNLFSEPELDEVRERVAALPFRAALSTTLKARVTGEAALKEFVVPNDCEEVCLSTPTERLAERTCEVSVLEKGTWLFEFLKSRALAVSPRDCEGEIRTIIVERYLPGQLFAGGHFSHQRVGAVLMPLETSGAGGLQLLSVGLQLTPLAGMGLWLPSRYGPPIPDLRADFSLHNPGPAPLHYVVALMQPGDDEGVEKEF